MAENPAPTQSWCAHYPLALPINQQQSKQNVALQYRARSPSPQIISMGYAAHPCANCRRSVRTRSKLRHGGLWPDGLATAEQPPELTVASRRLAASALEELGRFGVRVAMA